MKFYKAKYDAATPTRVQVNVPTNTDYMVGTELYVKGEKKDITAENVTLKVDGTIVSPDTTVNGIPAFTMKSLDAEADKLYEVEFKSEITAYTALSGTSNDDFDYALSSNNHCWTAKKELVLTSPIIYGTNKEIRKQYTDLKLNRTDGTVVDFVNLQAAWTGVLTAEINGNIYQLWGISPKDPALSSLGDLTHMPLWSLIDQSHAYAFVTEPLVCPVGTVFKAKATGITGKTCGVEIKNGESYNYKFKLFINEDEQSYGSIDINGTTPAEVSAIVDDAIAAYDSQLSTVNLSGTFDDDSTFSYNFVIKN